MIPAQTAFRQIFLYHNDTRRLNCENLADPTFLRPCPNAQYSVSKHPREKLATQVPTLAERFTVSNPYLGFYCIVAAVEIPHDSRGKAKVSFFCLCSFMLVFPIVRVLF